MNILCIFCIKHAFLLLLNSVPAPYLLRIFAYFVVILPSVFILPHPPAPFSQRLALSPASAEEVCLSRSRRNDIQSFLKCFAFCARYHVFSSRTLPRRVSQRLALSPRLGRRGLPQPSTSYHRLKRRETHCRSVGFSQCGRRERDSNPRNGQAVHRISSPAQSVTLASLHACSHAFAGAKVRKKEKEKKRIKKKITEKTKKQLCNTVARLFPYLCSVKTRICNVTH